jgi:hypothetical protein
VGHIGKPPLGEVDARLLRALCERYPDGHFDEHNIAVDAPGSPDLLDALDFLEAKIDRRRRALSHRSHEVLARWLDQIEGRPVDGFLLRRDRIGWCQVERHVIGPTGPAG